MAVATRWREGLAVGAQATVGVGSEMSTSRTPEQRSRSVFGSPLVDGPFAKQGSPRSCSGIVPFDIPASIVDKAVRQLAVGHVLQRCRACTHTHQTHLPCKMRQGVTESRSPNKDHLNLVQELCRSTFLRAS